MGYRHPLVRLSDAVSCFPLCDLTRKNHSVSAGYWTRSVRVRAVPQSKRVRYVGPLKVQLHGEAMSQRSDTFGSHYTPLTCQCEGVKDRTSRKTSNQVTWQCAQPPACLRTVAYCALKGVGVQAKCLVTLYRLRYAPTFHSRNHLLLFIIAGLQPCIRLSCRYISIISFWRGGGGGPFFFFFLKI